MEIDLMELRITSGDLPAKGALVVFIGADGRLSAAAERYDGEAGGAIRRAAGLDAERRKHGRIQHLLLPAGLPFDHLLLVTVGKEEKLTSLEVEELGGGIVQRLTALRVGQASIASTDGLDLGIRPAEAAGSLALGARLRSYRFSKYRGSADKDEATSPPAELVFAAGPEAGGEDTLAEIEAVAKAVSRARDLVSEPANVLYPRTFAEACRELEALGVEVEILEPARLEQLGMRALLAVGQGSARPPHAVVMRWRGAKQDHPLALVGKGVCFDTGGISIKPAGGMEDMKWDMAGAGAVFGAMMALAGRKAKADVVGVIGLAENMPSATAQRPGDVVTAMSGKTIEVINTDAEGRLVLADMVWYAKETFKPRAIIDLATLTGAIIVALGHERAGLFASDDALAGQLTAAGERVGEKLWRMPLGKDYEKHIKSEIAEIKNVGRARQAGATAGAVFIQQFVGDVPWAHLDIAGVAWSSRDLPLAGKGATAFGVRLLDAYVRAECERPGG
jgi:leucyl aminopeptidase